MYFREMLKRAELNSIENFLLSGEEVLEKTQGYYTERLKAAEAGIGKFFEARFTDLDECDETFMHFYNMVDTYREVFFEIGLFAGAKIAMQINKKLEELW